MKHDIFTPYQRNQHLQQKLLFVVAVIVSLVALSAATQPDSFEVFAATATASTKASPKPTASPKVSPSPVASPSGEAATENLKDRIDRILETRQEKLQELEQAGQRRRIFVGEVQRITERTVTLHNRRGNQSFTVGPDVVLSKAGKAATIDDIAVGDSIGVIGFSDKETIQPQIVIISATSLQPADFTTVIGNIKTISKTQIVVTSPSGAEQTAQIVKATQFENSNGEAIKLTDLQTETQVIVVSKPNGNLNPASLIRSLAGQR